MAAGRADALAAARTCGEFDRALALLQARRTPAGLKLHPACGFAAGEPRPVRRACRTTSQRGRRRTTARERRR